MTHILSQNFQAGKGKGIKKNVVFMVHTILTLAGVLGDTYGGTPFQVLISHGF